MSDKKNPGQSGGMALNDIYFVLFRHKWKIMILSTIGIVAAVVLYAVKPPTYLSEANLLIKYVKRDTPQSPGASTSDPSASSLRDLDPGVEGVLNGEVVMLNSFDLAFQVATNIGPARILGIPGGPNDVSAANAAANRIKDNLTVERFPRSALLNITLVHPDMNLVQPILTELIEVYETRHNEIHNGALNYDTLVQTVADLRKEMQQTEEELRKAKNDANVNNVERKKDTYEDSLAALHQRIMFITSELTEHQTLIAKLKGVDVTNIVNAAATNSAATNKAATNMLADIPREKIDLHQQTTDLLADLKKQYVGLRTVYPLHNKLVIDTQAQIDEQKKILKKLEDEEPRLIGYVDPDTKNSVAGATAAPAGVSASLALKQEEDIVAGIQSKLKVLNGFYEEENKNSASLDARAFHIRELEYKLKSEQKKFEDYDNVLRQKNIDTQLGTIKDANIAVTEKPTPPSREKMKTPKMMGVLAGGGIALGLAWAFLQELYLDHSVKRAKDIEVDLGMRLFLTIPDMERNGRRRKAKAKAKAALKDTTLAKVSPAAGPLVPAVNGSANGNGHVEVAPWDHNHVLHHHYEALRDRLITYFEINNLNHKPKLVAITGSSKGGGTSTIAAGLAASLSETGEGNVLLIDMNLEQGAAQQFFNGKPHCELDTALAGSTMKDAKVQDNLYIVAGRMNDGDKLSSMLPKHFANLIPKLKASDYDYIIFDMPPIGRTGVTQRLAGFMDMTMLVVEAEKTHRDVVRQANTLLTESKAKVSVVLNKTHNYVPARLHQEF